MTRGSQVGSPFDRQNTWDTACYDRSEGRSGLDWPGSQGQYVAEVRMSFPVTIAAIDPVQEAGLTGLDKAVVNGRYLLTSDVPSETDRQISVPIITSSLSLVDQVDQVTVDKLDGAAVTQLREGPSRAVARPSA